MAETLIRKFAVLAVLVLVAGKAAALTIGVVPAEGGAFAPPPDGPGSPLGYVVSGCMNLLFDSGYIATDTAAFRGARDAWESSGFELSGAREGLVDGILALYVEWAPSAFNKDVLLPATIAYRLLRVSDGKLLVEGVIAGGPDSVDASLHFTEIASRAGSQVVLACVESLRTLAMGGEK